jgi:hypothetical protein
MDGHAARLSTTLGKRKRHDKGPDIILRHSANPKLYDNIHQEHVGDLTNVDGCSSPSRQKTISLEVCPIDSPTSHVAISSNSLDRLTCGHEPWTANYGHGSSHLSRFSRRSPKIRRRVLRESSVHSNTVNSAITPQISSKSEPISLDRCHICQKAPKMKSDLDSYDNCWRCKMRICYICVRMCEADLCGGRKICSSCCVEQGEDGVVCCLDCLGAVEDHVMEESTG